ncbi:MAG: hypothetical protein JXR11_14220 [Balneola sp.]
MSLKLKSELNKFGNSSKLVVFLHAYGKSGKSLYPLAEITHKNLPDADIYIPELPTSLFSFTDPNAIVVQLVKEISNLYRNSSGGYKEIVFAGHSLGALLARKVYICACGEYEDAPFEAPLNSADFKAPQEWAKLVTRIILIAGMNRGWRISHHLSKKNAVIWSLGYMFAALLTSLNLNRLLIYNIKKGASFLTQLRIQWITMKNKAPEKGVGNAQTIQLLGSVDDMVSPKDNIDLVSGRDFIYLDVPYSGHANIIDLKDENPAYGLEEILQDEFNKNTVSVGDIRSFYFKICITNQTDLIEKHKVLPSDYQYITPREKVDLVVFVIHGIRDTGYWTHKIARRVVKLAHLRGDKSIVETETSSYGYFPMISFILPMRRRNKVEWFMDQYAECLANYPNAKFSFVGHSNGTYLLAKALEEYPCCRFDNIVFAGSVVDSGFKWQRYIDSNQVKKVLNFVASKDLVVAVFPKGIRKLLFQDLGGAGHDGFTITHKNPGLKEHIHQIKFIHGGHSAALTEKNWNTIAHFILTGEIMEPPSELINSKRGLLTYFFGSIAPIILLAIITLIVFSFITLFYLNLPLWQALVFAFLYAIVLSVILRKL